MHFVDDEYLELSSCWFVPARFDDLSDIVYAGVTGRIYFYDVDLTAARKFKARLTFAAWLWIAMLTPKSFGQYASNGRFPDSSRARKQHRRPKTILLHPTGDDFYRDVLSNYIRKPLWSVFCC
jgi:hypothetical protein